MLPEPLLRATYLGLGAILIAQGWRWRLRRARRARKPALLRVAVLWPGHLVSSGLERAAAWTLCGVLLALSTALVVGAIQGQARWADVGLNAVYCAFAINMFFLLRGPETFVIHRGGVTWRWRAYRWRDIYGFEAHPERKGPNLSLKTRRERVEIPIPADRLQETTATLEAFRPRFNRPRAALTAIPAST